MIEAVQFANKFCVDSRKKEIIDEMRRKLDNLSFEMLGSGLARELDRVVRDICKEERMF